MDGAGGYTVGRLMPAADSLALGGLPIGLAHGMKLVKPVAAGKPITWSDVEAQDSDAVWFRRDMERMFETVEVRLR